MKTHDPITLKRIAFPLLLLAGSPVSFGADSALAEWKRDLRSPGDAWARSEQEFVFNNSSEPQTLDPHRMTGSPEIRLARALFEGLTTLDPRSLTPRPGVASGWRVSTNGLTYTFTLRPDARWSDGQALTAHDFVRSWRRVLTPATGAAYANLLFAIEGAEELLAGKTGETDSLGVRATADNTLVVRLRHPCAYFLELTAFPTLYPVRADIIDAHGDAWTRAEHFVGNGPFSLDAWEPRRHVIMKRSSTYWDRDFVRLRTVKVLPFDDHNTAYQLFLKGAIDWMPAVPQARIDEVRRHPDYYVTPFFGTYFYRFNVTMPPFDDKRVRRAFCMATDRHEITDHILKSGQRPVTTLCPPIGDYAPEGGRPFDPRGARELLADAGYGPDGRDFPPVEILYNTSEAHKLIAEAIAQQWKRALDVTVSSRNVEWKTFLSDMRQLKYQVCRSSWIGDYGDPSTFYDCFTSDDGNNRTGWSRAAYDALAEAARATVDSAHRRASFQKMERLLVEDACPILPIYGYVNQGMLAEHVLGWFPNIRNVHNLKYVWIEKE